MAKNDVILLDSVIKATKEEFGDNYELSETFELFSFDQILKNYDLSFEEIEFGWIDGKDDGGIDGLFLFVDDTYITEKPESKRVRNEPKIELLVITCKHTDSFKQEPINSIISTVTEFFDLTKQNDDLTADYNEEALKVRELFRETFIELAIKKPTLSIRYIYACRGDSTEVAENILSKSELLVEKTEDLFSEIKSEFIFFGATELLESYRKKKNFSLRLRFIENTISRAKTNYIVLSKLNDIYDFITDENDKLRRYLFESNVRDYLGDVGVNQDIENTLDTRETEKPIDFWWLNNGITILASSANVAGKEISLENIQIVNGLQTTETIYKYFNKTNNIADDRAALIKIIVTSDDAIRDSIIKATNNQSPVDVASLRAMDKIQRDIEQIFFDNDLYYDRRKNYYKNLGKPADRIISLTYLSCCVQALCFGELAKATKLKTKFFRDDDQYKRIFNENWKIETFLRVVQIQKAIDKELIKFNFPQRGASSTSVRQYKYLFSYSFIVLNLRKAYFGANEILKVDFNEVSKTQISEIWDLILECETELLQTTRSTSRKVKKPHRNVQLHDSIKQKLEKKIKNVP